MSRFPPDYLNLRLPVRKRLESRKAAKHVYTFASAANAYAHLSAGFNGEGRHRVRVWYTHTGEYFRNERDAKDYLPLHSRHQGLHGWYTDTDCRDTAVGIVAALPHSRFLAGYRWTSNGERVWFDTVHDDAKDAALTANEHARVFAEHAREDDERSRAANDLQYEIEEGARRVAELFALRHRNGRCFEHVRDELARALESLRAKRHTLTTEYGDYL